jgi:pyrimidine-specific ribonucleoside hydrolase
MAPQTNIALLLRTYPEAAEGLRRIVFMGGSAGRGNATASAEFNVWHDPEAAAIVLAACGELDIPVTMYGLDVFNAVTVDGEDASRLRGLPDPAAQMDGNLIDAQRELNGTEELSIGDAGAVCAVLDPDGLGTRSYPVRVETAPGFTRGQTIVDRRDWVGDLAADPHAAPETVVDVALEVDAARYARLWLGAFET